MYNKFLKYIPESEHEEFLNTMTYETVNTLNEALQLDHEAMSALASLRVTCSPNMGDKFFVTKHSEDSCTVGLLGILNGLLPSKHLIFPVYFKKPASLDSTSTLTMFVAKKVENEKDEE